MSLLRLHLEARNSPASEFYEDYRRDNWDLDPPYQRGAVWTDEQRRNLIRSLLMGIPIGAIILNVRPFDADLPFQQGAVIDGKQRIVTLRMFRDGQFATPRQWWLNEELVWSPDNENVGVTWNDLSLVGQRRFSNIGIAGCWAHVATVKDEAEIYLLVNFGGVAQTNVDRARAEGVTGNQHRD